MFSDTTPAPQAHENGRVWKRHMSNLEVCNCKVTQNKEINFTSSIRTRRSGWSRNLLLGLTVSQILLERK